MISTQLEVFLGNISFVILFLSMILYWVEAIFAVIPQFNKIIFLTTLLTNLSLFFLLIFRWFNYNHFPLSNLYESLLFLSWSFTGIQLVLEQSLLKNFQSHVGTTSQVPTMNTIIGTIISPIALFTNTFATFSLPKTMQKAQALVPALQSNWLMMHVTVMMLSYTALLCGSLLAITFLIVTWYNRKRNKKILTNFSFLTKLKSKIKSLAAFQNEKEEPSNVVFKLLKTNVQPRSDFLNNQLSFTNPNLELVPKSGTKKRTPLFLNSEKIQTTTALFGAQLVADSDIENELSSKQVVNLVGASALQNSQNQLPIHVLTQTLDNLSYRILGIGFPLLTIGILSGAVWANEAWGSYWSWDPKETWAFITWLVFAIYLHVRIVKGWEGEKPAILASFGFFVVWICYLGVNLLGTGLHSYGWIQ